MSILAVLLDPILPVFAILAFGFVSGHAGWAGEAEARTINRFAMTVLLPILVFDLMASAPVHSFRLAPVAIYAGAEIAFFALGYWLARRIFQRSAGEAVLLGLCGIFGNNAFYVLPISILLYGEAGVLPVVAIVTLDVFVVFGGAMLALELIQRERATPLGVAVTLLRLPMVHAIWLGLVFALSGLALPGPLQTFVDFNGSAAAPVALYALGVVLAGTQFRAEPVVAAISAVKLVLFPAAVWAALALWTPEDQGAALYTLAAAGPAGAMGFSLALLYGVRTDAIAQVLVWTSLLSLGTLALLA